MVDGKSFRLADEVRYVQRCAAKHDGRIITLAQLILFSTRWDAWLLKHLLATRPIFHKLDETIRGHVFCNFLALVLKKALGDRIAALARTGSWPDRPRSLLAAADHTIRSPRRLLLGATSANHQAIRFATTDLERRRKHHNGVLPGVARVAWRRLIERLIAGRSPGNVLLRRDDGRAWKRAEQLRPMREVCARAGIIPAVGFHVLRHTHASILGMQAVPMVAIARQYGHSDTRMTEIRTAGIAHRVILQPF